MFRNISAAVKYKIQTHLLESCPNSDKLFVYFKISEEVKKRRREKIKNMLENHIFINEINKKEKIDDYRIANKERKERFQQGLEAVNKFLKKNDEIGAPQNSLFCTKNVADSLFPIGRKIDFFFKQKIVKSLFL